MASEESCVYADGSGLELGLDLSLGCGKAKAKSKECPIRILTAKDFDSVISPDVSSSSSSSSSSVTRGINAGTKRSSAVPSSPPPRKVVGWPPVRSYRANTLVVSHSSKPTATEEFLSKNLHEDNINRCAVANVSLVSNGKQHPKMSSFVKVTMDGISIGRKVDLLAHSSYKTLALSLDEMFLHGRNAGPNEDETVVSGTRSPDFVLTYEDKDGDWMLVGDVPWEMFTNNVRRLRIMRAAAVV